MISINEALAAILASAVPIERRERVPLFEADGRVLAHAPAAPFDVPPFDRAAMDGYAVVSADTTGATRDAPRTLRCVGALFTGDIPSRRVDRGECIQIATGAPLPDGADAVVMVEQTTREDDDIRVMAPAQPRQNVGSRGADIAAGRTVLREGDVLTPARVGVLAAIGASEAEVFARPRVAILSTGNELAPPGTRLAPGQIYDINRFTLSSIVRANGGVPVVYPTIADTLEALIASVREASTEDVLVFSGGSSVGERDLILEVLRRLGDVVFHGIAIKPGKPTGLGRIDGRPALAMPGNPTSCLSNAYLLLAPMLRRIARLPARREQTVELPLARRIVSAAGRHQFYTVRIVDTAVEPAFKSSGDITSMADADGYIEIPADAGGVEAGEIVRVTLF
jgi:molybdenum cofactor synthesis domain-containing protein